MSGWAIRHDTNTNDYSQKYNFDAVFWVYPQSYDACEKCRWIVGDFPPSKTSMNKLLFDT